MGFEPFNLPQGHFGAILADPPWAFRTYSGKHTTPHRCAEDHYVTVPKEGLAALPVGTLAAKDCALFMWVVDSHIAEGIDLGRAWGFEYKTRAFTWRKLTVTGKSMIGMGYWTRKQTEICLLFTKGKPKRKSRGVREVIEAQRREHSRKPDEQYARIEALVDGPYVELFARAPHPNWSAWGNQVDKFTPLAA